MIELFLLIEWNSIKLGGLVIEYGPKLYLQLYQGLWEWRGLEDGEVQGVVGLGGDRV